MTIDEIWRELESEPTTDLAWTSRFARPGQGYPLLIALEPATRTRALLLPASKAALPPRRDWPECQGLELISVVLSSQPHLGVRLRDRQCADVFTALAEDVSIRIADADGPLSAARQLLSRLRRWQQFLSAAREGLSIEAQRGLWGELHTLRTHLLPTRSAAAAIRGWKASSAAHQDFQFPSGALEVKTTAAMQPQTVRITSERQLDATGVGDLFLHVVVVDERDVSAESEIPGLSLPAIVSAIRATLAAETMALIEFNDRLIEAGWIDLQAPRYDGRRLTPRQELTFRVSGDFPRLTEQQLPAGVGDVDYALSLAACTPFAVSQAEMSASLR